jgi:hypothetical protein
MAVVLSRIFYPSFLDARVVWLRRWLLSYSKTDVLSPKFDYPTRYPLFLYAGSSILLGSEGTLSDWFVALRASVTSTEVTRNQSHRTVPSCTFVITDP